MISIEKFLQSVKTQAGLKGRLKRRLFGGIYACLEAADHDIKANEAKIESCRIEAETLESRANGIAEDVAALQETADELKLLEQSLRSGIEELGKSGTQLKALVDVYSVNLENLSINVRNNNSLIESLRSDTENLKAKFSGVNRRLKELSETALTPRSVTADEAAAPVVIHTEPQMHESEYEEIDYFDFENHFRGSIENIKKAQQIYLKYFENKSHVLDIGCGRGEFLSLLKENGVNAEGADIYEPYVDYCRMNGFKAVCADGTDYLDSMKEVDGIFVGQVVEHLEPHQIIRLCNTAYKKLSEGGCIVIETPNPTSLAIYTNAFYIDPSHVKPVHPLTMKYYLEKAGFKNIEIIYTEGSRPPHRIPELKCSAAENSDEFNAAMKTVSDIIFGSQDYAVAAVK